MDVLGDFVARERRSSVTAVSAPALGREMSYHDFCTTAWKAGNFFAFLGARAGSRVAIAPEPTPESLLALFGAALNGATASFDWPAAATDAQVAVVPKRRESAVDLDPGTKGVVYGDPPSTPGAAYWEREVWSENPAFPPTPVDVTAPALATADATYTHRTLVDAGNSVVEDAGLGADDAVAVRASLADSAVLVAGVVAPLLVGATVLFPAEDAVGTVAVVDEASAATRLPEERVVVAADVTLSPE